MSGYGGNVALPHGGCGPAEAAWLESSLQRIVVNNMKETSTDNRL